MNWRAPPLAEEAQAAQFMAAKSLGIRVLGSRDSKISSVPDIKPYTMDPGLLKGSTRQQADPVNQQSRRELIGDAIKSGVELNRATTAKREASMLRVHELVGGRKNSVAALNDDVPTSLAGKVAVVSGRRSSQAILQEEQGRRGSVIAASIGEDGGGSTGRRPSFAPGGPGPAAGDAAAYTPGYDHSAMTALDASLFSSLGVETSGAQAGGAATLQRAPSGTYRFQSGDGSEQLESSGPATQAISHVNHGMASMRLRSASFSQRNRLPPSGFGIAMGPSVGSSSLEGSSENGPGGEGLFGNPPGSQSADALLIRRPSVRLDRRLSRAPSMEPSPRQHRRPSTSQLAAAGIEGASLYAMASTALPPLPGPPPSMMPTAREILLSPRGLHSPRGPTSPPRAPLVALSSADNDEDEDDDGSQDEYGAPGSATGGGRHGSPDARASERDYVNAAKARAAAAAARRERPVGAVFVQKPLPEAGLAGSARRPDVRRMRPATGHTRVNLSAAQLSRIAPRPLTAVAAPMERDRPGRADALPFPRGGAAAGICIMGSGPRGRTPASTRPVSSMGGALTREPSAAAADGADIDGAVAASESEAAGPGPGGAAAWALRALPDDASATQRLLREPSTDLLGGSASGTPKVHSRAPSPALDGSGRRTPGDRAPSPLDRRRSVDRAGSPLPPADSPVPPAPLLGADGSRRTSFSFTAMNTWTETSDAVAVAATAAAGGVAAAAPAQPAPRMSVDRPRSSTPEPVPEADESSAGIDTHALPSPTGGQPRPGDSGPLSVPGPLTAGSPRPEVARGRVARRNSTESLMTYELPMVNTAQGSFDGDQVLAMIQTANQKFGTSAFSPSLSSSNMLNAAAAAARATAASAGLHSSGGHGGGHGQGQHGHGAQVG